MRKWSGSEEMKEKGRASRQFKVKLTAKQILCSSVRRITFFFHSFDANFKCSIFVSCSNGRHFPKYANSHDQSDCMKSRHVALTCTGS
jgi:hypothetical protein